MWFCHTKSSEGSVSLKDITRDINRKYNNYLCHSYYSHKNDSLLRWIGMYHLPVIASLSPFFSLAVVVALSFLGFAF